MTKAAKIGLVALSSIAVILAVIILIMRLGNSSQTVPTEATISTTVTSETIATSKETTYIIPPAHADDERRTFVLSPYGTNLFFGVTPREFMNTAMLIYSSCEDFRRHAKIDKDGNLVLNLTENQTATWLYFYGDTVSDAKELGVEIAEDYTSFYFKGYMEDIYEFPLMLVRSLQILQLFEGKNAEDISVHCVLVDAGTGETKVDVILPPEALEYSIGDFSPRPTD